MKIEELKALGVSDAAVSFCRGTSSTLVLNFGLGTQVVPEELATLDALETNGGEVVWAAEDSYKRVLSLNYAADHYSGTLTLTDRVERLNQCVYASINKLTGLPDFAVTRSAVVAAQNGNPASSVLVHTSSTVAAVMEYAGVSMSYTAQVPVHIVSAGVQSCMSHLNAAHVKLGWAHGEPGSVVLRLNKNAAGYVTGGEIVKNGEPVGTFEGISAVSLANRAGVGCPGAGLRGKYNITVGNLREPGAFCSFISPTVAGGDGGGPPTYAGANARANKVEVLGLKVPDGWKVENPEMRKVTNQKPGDLLKFWGSFPAFKTLAKVAGCVTFGGMWVSPLAAAEAFPADDGDAVKPEGSTEAGDTDPPANYLQAEPGDFNWQNAYVLYKGSFPASPHRRENVSGLKFCKATISQVVVLSSKPEGGTVSAEELNAFFDGVVTFDGKQRRYTELTLPEVWLINRRRKVYKEGTNSLFADDPDYAEEEETPPAGDEQDVITPADYRNFLQQQIRAGDNTYDGTVELVGVEANPLAFCQSSLSIEGLADIWQDMKTPIARVDYSFFSKRLTLTTGSDEAAALSVDELAEIARMQRQRDIAGQANNQPWTNEAVSTEPEEGEGEEEEEQAAPPMISPQISPTHGATKGGKPREPKTLYADGDKWLISAGVIATPEGYIQFPETDVTELISAGYMVKAGKKYDRAAGRWVPYVFRKRAAQQQAEN